MKIKNYLKHTLLIVIIIVIYQKTAYNFKGFTFFNISIKFHYPITKHILTLSIM